MLFIKEYIFTYLAVVFIGVISQIVIPSGEMKKYVKFFCSMLLIVTLVRPFTNDINFDFDIKNFNLDTYASEVEARERVLSKHRQNLEKKMQDYFSCPVHVILNDDGSISKINIKKQLSEDEKKYIEKEYGVTRDNILEILEE